MPKDELPNPPADNDPGRAADFVGRSFFDVGSDEASRRKAILRLLIGAVEATVLVPLIFFLQFREVGPLGWGTTVFFVAFCLLSALGLYFAPHTEFHTPVALKGDWADRVGAFWLVACVFGPLFGWGIIAVFPLNASSWRWIYGTQVFLAAGLPLVTALPLTRYLRGKATLIALPLLLIITSLPVMTAANTSRDLLEGPTTRLVQPSGSGEKATTELYLKHTQKVIDAGN